MLTSLFVSAKSSTDAATSDEKFPQIADYYQLMQMSEHDRITYVTEVVRILSDLEKDGVYFSSAQKNYQSANGFLQWMLSLPSAHADPANLCENVCPANSTALNLPGGRQACLSNQTKCAANEVVVCSNLPEHQCDNKCSCVVSAVLKPDPQAVVYDPINKSFLKARVGAMSGTAPSTGGGSSINSPPGFLGGVPIIGPGAANPPIVVKVITLNPRIETIITQDQVNLDVRCQPHSCPDRDAQYRSRVKENFNGRVESSDDVRCINGGMISTYSLHGANKCAAVTKYKIGHLSLSCSSGKTMCNPLLFGLKNDDPAQPLCVPIGVEMTEKCFELSGGPGNAKKFWKRSDISHEDMSEAWNKLRSNLTNDLCSEKASADYHCKECAIIAQRLRGLHKFVDKCANACGDHLECTFSNKNSIKKLNHSDTRDGGQ